MYVKRDSENPGIASIANLALVDVLSALWFFLAIVLPDSAAWTDQTLYFQTLQQAKTRGLRFLHKSTISHCLKVPQNKSHINIFRAKRAGNYTSF